MTVFYTNATSSSKSGLLLASAIIILLFFLSAVGSAVRRPVTQGFDEVAHVSYVAHLQATPERWPQFERMRMLDPVSFQFTSGSNYLNHPPVYYWLVAALGPEISGRPGSLIYLRLLNVFISAIGMIGLLALAARMKLNGLPFYAFVIMAVTTPVLAPLAGAVNNDNLAFAGGVFTILGAYAYFESGQRSGLMMACCGMLVASMAKLTGFLLAGGFLATLCALMIWRRTTSKMDVAIIASSLIVAAAPYLAFVLQYGTPAPNTPAQMDLLREGASVAGWASAPRLGPFAYSLMFLTTFVSEWMPSLHQRNSLQLSLLALPIAVLTAAAAGAFLSFREIVAGRGEVTDSVVAAGMLAIVVTFTIHMGFSYQRHVETGWMMDAYPRYYLPMIAIIPLAALRFSRRIEPESVQALALSLLVVAPLVFGLFGAPF